MPEKWIKDWDFKCLDEPDEEEIPEEGTLEFFDDIDDMVEDHWYQIFQDQERLEL